MEILKRGGFRAEFKDGKFTIYADADKLADSDAFDVPEVAVLVIDGDDVRKLRGAVRAEWERFAGRGFKIAVKKKKK